MFADVEGQGDRDAAYDARLASAILPLTKCVIFNWRDSLQVDRMLNLLGVMQRAAHNVDLGERVSLAVGVGARAVFCLFFFMYFVLFYVYLFCLICSCILCMLLVLFVCLQYFGRNGAGGWRLSRFRRDSS